VWAFSKGDNMSITWRDTAGTDRAGKTEFVGAVLGVTSRDERIMSDVYAVVTFAIVWDEATAEVRHVAFRTDGFGISGDVVVDATDETKARAFAFWAKVAFARMNGEFDRRVAEHVERAKTPSRYVDVVIARGCPKLVDKVTKVALGTVGRVFWMGDSGFGSGFGPSVGIELANGGKLFTAQKNVDVANPVLDADLMKRPDYTEAANTEAAKKLLDVMPSFTPLPDKAAVVRHPAAKTHTGSQSCRKYVYHETERLHTHRTSDCRGYHRHHRRDCCSWTSAGSDGKQRSLSHRVDASRQQRSVHLCGELRSG
jgi:hypothetical protein